jgi:uncharacterized protein YyaL (SSP411 family)
MNNVIVSGGLWKGSQISSNLQHTIPSPLLFFFQMTPALSQALLSLDKMIEGGIYDQVAGGFARYATDTKWLSSAF